MSVVLTVSAKGSPGASLTTMGVTHCWPREVLGLEVDPAGGSWPLTFGLTSDPGLMDFAAEQGSITDAAIDRCSTRISDRARVICAPRESLLTRRALEWMGNRLEAWPDTIDVVADGGRLDASAGHPLLSRADALLVCTHTTPAAIGSTAQLITSLDRSVRSDVLIRIVTVASGPYSPSEVVDALAELAGPRVNIALGAALPFDRRLAETLANGGKRAGKVCGSWFGELATSLAAATAHRSVTSSSLSMVGGV
jgi:hypothetical protein